MKRDWVVWLGCFLLFGMGALWARVPISNNFFVVENVHDLFEILGAIATVAAVLLAAAGINAWRSQLQATSDHELARRLLVSLYKYREAVRSIRHPMIMSSETSPGENEKRSDDSDIDRFQGLCKAYDRRFKAAGEIRILLLSEILEADVAWGEKLKNTILPLVKLEFELNTYIQTHLRVINPSAVSDMRIAHAEILKKRRDIMYDDLSVEGDEFTQEFNKKLELSEKYLKDKFIR
ncbi:hypothetical protein JFT61_19600 [Pseudomonas fluorescens]|nr:hypothetical protein [Pseudomonas fluorescens]